VKVPGLDYHVFHYLEQVQQCFDAEASDWNGDRWHGVSSLVLDEAKTPDRAVLFIDTVHLYLKREDLRRAIQQQGITGFSFVRCDRYYSGSLAHGDPSKVPWED
jgi:hypothetical protein